ncbi:hypothetical protein TWF970_006210 [Orbilia oligospora]|uniref:Major facilitator superfamily (MFS) profile domain-containing protein n=1 Tax=Orbilia oligospora TaxID=2813651 RepID=A0A7C8VF31_ORBOL|nr:hypothetical protein TWF970_006210 [Orbilia oligospora]
MPASRILGFFTGKSKSRPIWLNWRSSKEFIIATVSFGIFVDILLYSIVVPVLPFALVSRARVTEDSVQGWISIMLAVYGAGLLVASPIFGYIADHTKYRRSPFLWGLILLAASTAMFLVGNSIPVLVVARLIQGMSGGCIWVVGLALVIDTVPANEQAQSMGFVSIGLTAGSSLGPLLGGVIYDKAGYTAVFILAFAVIGFDIIMRLLVIEKAAAKQWMPEPSAPDADGANLEDQKPEDKKANPQENIREAMLKNRDAATVLRKESRVPAIILLLKSPRTLNSLFITVMLGSIFTAFDAVLPLRVKYVFHFNSTAAGLIFLAIIIPTLVAPLCGKISDKYGPRWLVVTAFFVCLPLFILLRLPQRPVAGHIALLCALLFCIGFVISASMPGAMSEISISVVEFEKESPGIFGEKGAFAQAYALFNIAWSLGSVVGPLLGGFLNKAIGWNSMVLLFGFLCLLTSFVTIWYTGGKITKDDLPWSYVKPSDRVKPGDVALDALPGSSSGSSDEKTSTSKAGGNVESTRLESAVEPGSPEPVEIDSIRAVDAKTT